MQLRKTILSVKIKTQTSECCWKMFTTYILHSEVEKDAAFASDAISWKYSSTANKQLIVFWTLQRLPEPV